jgi:hypothetical protein
MPDEQLAMLYEKSQAQHIPVQNLILDYFGARFRKPLQKILLRNRATGGIYAIERQTSQ